MIFLLPSLIQFIILRPMMVFKSTDSFYFLLIHRPQKGIPVSRGFMVVQFTTTLMNSLVICRYSHKRVSQSFYQISEVQLDTEKLS